MREARGVELARIESPRDRVWNRPSAQAVAVAAIGGHAVEPATKPLQRPGLSDHVLHAVPNHRHRGEVALGGERRRVDGEPRLALAAENPRAGPRSRRQAGPGSARAPAGRRRPRPGAAFRTGVHTPPTAAAVPPPSAPRLRRASACHSSAASTGSSCHVSAHSAARRGSRSSHAAPPGTSCHQFSEAGIATRSCRDSLGFRRPSAP